MWTLANVHGTCTTTPVHYNQFVIGTSEKLTVKDKEKCIYVSSGNDLLSQ